MKRKQILLMLVSVVLVAGFFALPPNFAWAQRVLGYLREIPEQRKQPDLETRMRDRLSDHYIYSKEIAQEFEKRGISKKVLVLMPVTNYFSERGISYHVPEPAVFYYFTGLKTVWPNSPHAVDANWYVSVRAGKIVVDSVTDLKQLQDSIAVFKKWGITL